MKKSEQLAQEANQEENDLASMGIMKKSFREARLEKWNDNNYTPRLEAKGYIVIPWDGTKVSIDTNRAHGIVDFFPKSNRLLFRRQSKWINHGLVWIERTLLKDE